MLKLFNTLTRKKETFKPIKKEEVGMYNCGPTVYWYPHIGNFRTYIFSDILMRILMFNGYKVKQVMNVTDVGHLTSDADSGEDKVEKAAAKEGKNAKEITNFYWNAFKEDMKKLNILEPTIWSKATEHIKEQIALIKKLEEKGYTYKTDDGIYFDTSKFKNYGKMAGLKKENIIAGKRVDMKEKKHNTDFALWKFSLGVKRQQEWNSPWGLGYPGWHIECSAMSMKYLGEHFDSESKLSDPMIVKNKKQAIIDIHTGGEDHIPIHHTNEIAQSEAATGKKFVNYWLHGSFLTFKGEKVSKSKGGLYTIQELEDLTYKPLAYRYLCLNSHYRSQMDFSLENLENAQNSYNRLKNIIENITDDGKMNKEYLKEFENAINDDLNMPEAIQVLWKLVRDEKAEGKLASIKKMDEVLGLKLLEKEKIEISKEVKELAEERQQARENKNWEKSDELRDKINKLGFQINDTKEGYVIKKI